MLITMLAIVLTTCDVIMTWKSTFDIFKNPERFKAAMLAKYPRPVGHIVYYGTYINAVFVTLYFTGTFDRWK